MADTNQIVVGHFEPDGSDIYLPLGFKPDYFLLVEIGVTHILQHSFFGRQEDDEASGAQEGIKADGDGTCSHPSAGEGFAAYDSEAAGPTITRWSSGGGVTAKTAAAHGSYIKPSVASAMDKEAVFEVIAGTTLHTSEPTWPAAIGERVTDGNSVTLERVNVPTARVGYQGILIPGELQTNAQEMYYMAIQADKVIDHGDVEDWSGGVYGA